MEIYGYCRVSGKDQNEGRQLVVMQEMGVQVGNIFIDKQSGKDFNRPKYKKLIRKIKKDDLIYIKSIDRLGRNYEDIIEQWKIITKEKRADIVVIYMPILDTRRGKDLMGTFLSDIVLALLSYISENERENIRQRQAEGIAVAKAKGIRFGPTPLPIPDNFHEIYQEWKLKKIKPDIAAKQCNMAKSTFYNKVHQYEKQIAYNYEKNPQKYNIEDVRNTIYEASVAIVVNSVMLIIYAIFISYYSFKVAFIILMSLLFYSIICFFLANPLRIINMKIKGDAEDVISFLKECSEGYDFIKTHNIKDKIISMMNDRIKTYSDSLYKGSIFYNKVISVKNYLSDLYNFCILGLCVFLIYKGFLSVGEVVSLYLIFSYMLDAVNRVIDIIPQTKTVGVAIDRIDDVLNGLTEDDTNKIDYSAGDIEFKNVDFSYDGGYQVFNDLNLKFLQGESVAIIGNNGSGKSTLAKILLNIYDLDSGIITVNGRDITQIKKEELKKNILYIPTSPFIFSGTIIDNLLFEKKQNVSEEEIIEVCKKVGLHDYIDSLPEKYNSYMIENGSSFSSGQKQRFELARLLLNKPAVIIFDEITSNMDNDGITLFKEIVSEIKKDSIIIINTHNIEMANMCDNIYLINKKNMTCINGEKDERYFNNHRC